MLTVDADVWVAAFDPGDVCHDKSVAFLAAAGRRGLILRAPAFLLVEVACAIARRTKSSSQGHMARDRILAHPLLRLEPLTDSLLATAARIGTDRLIRGADALYAAAAAITDTTLVSWDQELVARADAETPASWLGANA